jgi:SAM-dependent methyltransferase
MNRSAMQVGSPRRLTVVLPLFGVEAAMPTLMRDLAVAAYALRDRGVDMDVLLLDGGVDDSARIAAAAAERMSLPVRILDVTDQGTAAAFGRGLTAVVEQDPPDLVTTLDANGRHDPTQIPHMVDHLVARDLDVVIGSRWANGSGTPGLSIRRWVLGRAANLAFRAVSGIRGVTDATTSFRVARTEVVRAFDIGRVEPLTSHSIQTAFVASAVGQGFKIGEAPILYRASLVSGGELQWRAAGPLLASFAALRRDVGRARRRRLSIEGREFDHEHFGASEDLERLGTAAHFFDWVLEEFEPWLVGHVLEVGAGLGTITRRLLDRFEDVHVVALEPAANMFADLESVAAVSPRLEAHQCTLAELPESSERAFDAVLYLNVLEHIADDEKELALAAQALRRGGALLIFGPAIERLYSELDHRAGHYRRYRLADLCARVEAAGLRIVSARYFDVLGVLPYLVVYRILGRTTITGSTLWGYDRVVVPVSRALQRLLDNPPLGKNVVVVAQRP